jgi:hypothetical protein
MVFWVSYRSMTVNTELNAHTLFTVRFDKICTEINHGTCAANVVIKNDYSRIGRLPNNLGKTPCRPYNHIPLGILDFRCRVGEMDLVSTTRSVTELGGEQLPV